VKAVRHIVVRGRVQGVGYRAFVEAAARRRGLVGWVRNRRDGSVEAVFAGNPEAVRTMIDACRRGPPGARVAGIAEREGREDELHDGARFVVLGTL
jgi:acylphosphatase